MCLDSVACIRRQPGGGTTLCQGFVTMPILEERTSEETTSDNSCYLFAQHMHRKIPLSALLRWLHIFLLLQCQQRKSCPQKPCSSACLPPHPTCSNTLRSPKGKMMVQEAPRSIRSSLGNGEKKQRASKYNWRGLKPKSKPTNKQQQKKQSRQFLTCGKLALEKQCKRLEDKEKLPSELPLVFKNHMNTRWVLAP